MADNGERNGAVSNLVEGTIAKVIARFVFPALLTGSIGLLTWYIRSSDERGLAHTVQLERVMANQDRLADRIAAGIERLSQAIVDTRHMVDDHEGRLRLIERRPSPTSERPPP